MPALLVGLHLFFTRTWLGLALRAAADDPDTAAFKRGYKALGARNLSYELNASPGKSA